MKSLEFLKNQENIFPEELQSKKIRKIVKKLRKLIIEMDKQIRLFTEYKNSQLEGDLAGAIIVSKSLADFFANNKILRVDLIAEKYRNEEKAKLNCFYTAKNNLLDGLKLLLRESQKEAVVSCYDVFEGEYQKCESGHEVVILNGRNNDVIETFIRDIDEYVVLSGNYDNLSIQEVDFNTEVLDRNIALCNRKNEEFYGTKPGRKNKVQSVINKLYEVGKQVVAFYTYKETLLEIGCKKKNLKLYENELSKSYIPLKKILQKEFKIQLEDICDVVVNEEQFSDNIEELNTTNNLEDNQKLTENTLETETVSQKEPESFDLNPTNLVNENEVNITEEPDTTQSPTQTFEEPTTSPFLNDNPTEKTVSSPFLNDNPTEETVSSPFLDSNSVNPFDMVSANTINTTQETFNVPKPIENIDTELPTSPFLNNNIQNDSYVNPFDQFNEKDKYVSNSTEEQQTTSSLTNNETALPNSTKKNMFDD